MTVHGFKNPDDVRQLKRLIAKRGGGPRGINYRDPGDGIVFYNDSGETVPARAPMLITGATTVDTKPILTITKPDDSDGQYVFNGPLEVAAGDYGECFVGPLVIAAKSGTATAGLGFGVDEWELTSTGAPWLNAVACGAIDADTGLFMIYPDMVGLFKSPGGGIAAASAADTPGSATCVRYNSEVSPFAVFSPSCSAVVYNFVESFAVEGDTFVHCHRKRPNGRWYVTTEPCVAA